MLGGAAREERQMPAAGVGPPGGAGLREAREWRRAGARGFAKARILPFAAGLPGNDGCGRNHPRNAWFRPTGQAACRA
ncbi:hypothetical protein SAMN05446635_1401 [Burkholderia sp. OK233]|nr:hypothetical protein SAMN05446635_1401 [Burkholderia sp. OK233]